MLGSNTWNHLFASEQPINIWLQMINRKLFDRVQTNEL